MGLQLIDRAKMVPQVDGADREKNPQHDGEHPLELQNSAYSLCGSSRTLALTYRKAEDHLQLSRGIGN